MKRGLGHPLRSRFDRLPLASVNRLEYRVSILPTNLGGEMNCASILPVIFLLATTSSFGQSLTRARTAGTECPVGMKATHSASLPASMNAGGSSGQGPAINGHKFVTQPPVPAINQQIHLIMTNLLPRDIVSAQFTSHGFSNKRRTVYAGEAQAPDISSTKDVVVDVKGNGRASSDLSLGHFTAVSSIDLNSITYADGSTWRSPSPGACSVVPDGIMLVAATK
jgi:hypothetical protein